MMSTDLRELAGAMEAAAEKLLLGTVFDHVWAWHLQRDAAQLRLLAQADRHVQREVVGWGEVRDQCDGSRGQR